MFLRPETTTYLFPPQSPGQQPIPRNIMPNVAVPTPDCPLFLQFATDPKAKQMR